MNDDVSSNNPSDTTIAIIVIVCAAAVIVLALFLHCVVWRHRKSLFRRDSGVDQDPNEGLPMKKNPYFLGGEGNTQSKSETFMPT